jgi:2-polyprenyl-6-methoxyphenol hydroxylase-like FAD-dependent oxidoreductase
MMPHQSQAACMAIEDAAALGILFNKTHFKGNVAESLSIYEAVRLPRVTKVQAAASRASQNINERIGKSQALLNNSKYGPLTFCRIFQQYSQSSLQGEKRAGEIDYRRNERVSL